jgi:sec-independent protein translocase protein TatA
MFGLGPQEMIIVGVIAVLLFGKRLPEVGRSLGKSLMEFKKGMRDIQGDLDISSTSNSSSRPAAARVAQRNDIDDYEEATAPKFDPPAREPVEAPSRNPA